MNFLQCWKRIIVLKNITISPLTLSNQPTFRLVRCFSLKIAAEKPYNTDDKSSIHLWKFDKWTKRSKPIRREMNKGQIREVPTVRWKEYLEFRFKSPIHHLLVVGSIQIRRKDCEYMELNWKIMFRWVEHADEFIRLILLILIPNSDQRKIEKLVSSFMQAWNEEVRNSKYSKLH